MEQNNNSSSKKILNNWIVRNIVLAIVGVLVLVLIVSVLLGIGTRHNKELAVPDFTNMTIQDAGRLADKRDVRLDITDSVFVRRMDRGVVFSQNPQPGSHVKKGRRILITINAITPQTVAMPALVGYSLRQAKTEIMSKGLQIGKLTYMEDIATNNVLEQSVNGRRVDPGTMIETETPIDLLLGLNPEDALTYIPHLKGYTYAVAKETIIDNSLNLGIVRYDETVMNYNDSIQAQVFMQNPAYTNEDPYPRGTKVDIYLTKDPSKIVIIDSKDN
ncbi:MAG: PASTA domain-containing protein [Bacteroidales bacterium]|nr:PASTA domain-containing protein [Bacteroidales bacterium]MDD4670805.1 PASTA domain-containing protein [Bacteroidales bacterium]